MKELREQMAKKNKVEDYRPQPDPERQLESKSGWCMTGHHKECKYQFTCGKCGCSCHKKGKK